MDPVDHYAKLKEAILALEDEAASLRETFLRPGARLRSNQFEVIGMLFSPCVKQEWPYADARQIELLGKDDR